MAKIQYINDSFQEVQNIKIVSNVSAAESEPIDGIWC